MINSVQRFLSVIVLLFLFAFSSHLYAHAPPWDLSYWQYIRKHLVKTDKHSLFIDGEVRFNQDISQFYYYKITGGLSYHTYPWLILATHLTFLRNGLLFSNAENDNVFVNLTRFEFQVTPYLHVAKNTFLSWRNRLELINLLPITFVSPSIRSSLMLTVFVKNCQRLRSIDAYDEVFYDTSFEHITQNRLIPLQMNFDLGDERSMSLFFMINHTLKISGMWYKTASIATYLKF